MERFSVSSHAHITTFYNWSDFWTTLYTLAVNIQRQSQSMTSVFSLNAGRDGMASPPAITQPASLELKRVLLQMFYCLLIAGTRQ